MPRTLSRFHLAKILLWIALILMAVAQCLPWEIVRVYPRDTFATGNTSFSQIPHSWTFCRPSVLSDPPPGGERISHAIELTEPASISTAVFNWQPFPAEIRIHQLNELRMYAESVPHSLGPFTRHGIPWVLLALIAWPLCFLAMLLCSFFAEPLSRARPILWFVRFFACAMLVWLLRNFIIAFEGTGPFFDTIGSGLWLTLTALALEIAALFLLPNPRPQQLRRSQ